MPDNNKHIKDYNAEDISNYLNRTMPALERNAMEKAALEDPFLAEAIEGYTHQPADRLPADLQELKKRVQHNVVPQVIPMYRKKMGWSIAASVIILLGMASTFYWFTQPSSDTIAQQKTEKETVSPPALSPKASKKVIPDSAASIFPEAPKKEIKKGEPVAQEPVSRQEKEIEPGAQNKVAAADRKITGAAVSADGEVATKDDIAANNFDIQQEEAEKTKDRPVSKITVSPSPTPVQADRKKRMAEIPASSNIFRGIITDANNNPLPFVNISIPNTNTNIYSDAKGNFRMVAADTQLAVYVKSTGFRINLENLHAGETLNHIVLQPESNILPGAATSAYGKKAKALTLKKDNEAEVPEALPVDGWINYETYLANNVHEPADKNIQRGWVELSFFVDQFGRLLNFKIEKSTCTSCNKEAIRLIKDGPAWRLLDGDTQASVTLTLFF